MIPYQYVSYASEETMNLYLEFLQIPGNRISFEAPNDFIITSDLINPMILAAHNAKQPLNPIA